MDTLTTLKTLQQAIVYFSNPDNCVAYMVSKRWKDGVICPNCGSREVKYMESRRVWQCKTRHPKSQFSVKVGSVYEDSPIGLDKWLTATWMVTNCKNGVSSYEIHRAIGVTQKSAWFMLHRLRVAMKEEHKHTMGSSHNNPIEVDETYIGGKAINKHLNKRRQEEKKTIVMGMLNRETRQVRAKVIPHARREVLQGEILKHVGFNAHVFTDGHVGYEGIDKYKNFTHRTVNHINQYVNGRVHTQGIENFWSLLKRGLNGTYVAVEPFHLNAYVDEQVFRYNNRKGNDGMRFGLCVEKTFGKRLTYKQLTGKTEQVPF
jgi:ISXO2-like transposase domain/Transposase zinc-ribbon domain